MKTGYYTAEERKNVMSEKNVVYRSHTVIESNNLGYIVNLINNEGIHDSPPHRWAN